MTTQTNVKTLAERCERVNGPDRNLDAVIRHVVLEGVGTGYAADAPAYTGSLDAAMTLVPKGWGIASASTNGAGCGEIKLGVFGKEQTVNGWGYSLALAICAAALRARDTRTVERVCPACELPILIRETGAPDDLVTCGCTTVSLDWLRAAAYRANVAQCDRSPKGQDPQGLGATHESTVPEGDAPTPTPLSNQSPATHRRG